ncbi:MAG: hypothetical protein ACI9OH_002079 [Oleispira sp.]|jgi:hypothetical protein
MAARALTTLLMMPIMVSALERLDDSSMSDVVAQEGVRLISEYEVYIQRMSVIDTDGNKLIADDSGRTSLSDITLATRVNRQQEIDFKIASKNELYEEVHGIACTAPSDCGTELGLAFFNRDLPYDLEVGAFEINGKSVAGIGITDFEVNAFANNPAFLGQLHANEKSLNVTAFAGGFEGRGIDLSVFVPKTAQFKQYVEVNGVKFASTVRFIDADPENQNLTTTDQYGNPNPNGVTTTIADYQGGLDMTNITVDIVPDGVRLGLPEMEDGVIAITDFRIGNDEIGYDYINDIVFKDIDLKGGYMLLKPGLEVGEDEVNIDMLVKQGTGFTYVYRDPNDQINARVELSKDLTVTGASLNTSSVNGLELGLGQVKGQIFIDDITLAPNFYTDVQRSQQAPLGELTVNLNIANTSYLHIQGN